MKRKKENNKEKKKPKKKKKEIEEKLDEESEDLEQKIEEKNNFTDINIDSEELQEFLTEDFTENSPSLGQIAIAPRENTRISRIEQQIGSFGSSEEENGFKYTPSNKEGEVKYVSDREISGPEIMNFDNLKKEKNFFTGQEVGFIHSESQNPDSNSIEKYLVLESRNIDDFEKNKKREELPKVERKNMNHYINK